MLAELARLEPALPLGASLAALVAAWSLLAGRRRTALNEALHELRRPLQALVLSTTAGDPPAIGGADLTRQTALALERLEREINGGSKVATPSSVAIARTLEDALARCRPGAAEAGTSLYLEAPAGDPIVSLDRAGFDQALDNLIINAVEHGGPLVLVGAEVGAGSLRVRVADSGRASSGAARRRDPLRVLTLLSGRRRHGHGLRVVRRIAAAHGGEFHLRRLGIGVEALLELPLSPVGDAA
jgi:signal transduction histidine kinase